MRQLTYTTKGSKNQTYECRIKLDDNSKEIIWMDCTCWNFQNERIAKVGKGFNTKYTAYPCKHLFRQVNTLLELGYKLKDKSYSEGLDKLTPKLRKQILELYKYECLDCESKGNLQVHRICAGCYGGKYNIMNCVILCMSCHKMRHSREFL